MGRGSGLLRGVEFWDEMMDDEELEMIEEGGRGC